MDIDMDVVIRPNETLLWQQLLNVTPGAALLKYEPSAGSTAG
jgi:hypothetical protein